MSEAEDPQSAAQPPRSRTGNQLELFHLGAQRKPKKSTTRGVPFRRLDPDAELPGHANPGDAGLDLRAAIDVEVGPGERTMVPTGVAVAIPEGHAGLVLPRSGLASKHGLTMANAPGLIDSGYRGEVVCAVVNLDREHPVKLHRGDRIAQLVIVAVPEVQPAWVAELPPSSRGDGGFGSTGA